MHTGEITALVSIVSGSGLPMQVCFKMCLTFVYCLKGIHRRKQSLPKRRLGKMLTYDPISLVAMEISNETCLLCFDEFQVSKCVADVYVCVCACLCVCTWISATSSKQDNKNSELCVLVLFICSILKSQCSTPDTSQFLSVWSSTYMLIFELVLTHSVQ